MQNKSRQQLISPAALDRRHECSNPPIRWIVVTAGSVVLLMAACLGIAQMTTHGLEMSRTKEAGANGRSARIALDGRTTEHFSTPHLQVKPHDGLNELRARDDAELNGYGWVDRTSGIVRIPIARAMELIAQRGLPARASNATARTGPSSLELFYERAGAR